MQNPIPAKEITYIKDFLELQAVRRTSFYTSDTQIETGAKGSCILSDEIQCRYLNFPFY